MRTVTRGERFWRGYARVVVALRWVILALWIAGAVAAAVLLPSLSSAGGSPLGDIVPAESQALDAQQRAFDLFGAAVATDTILVQRNPRGLTDAELRANADAALAVREGRVPPEAEGIRAAVPLVNAQVGRSPWREDGTTALTFLFMDEELSLVRRREVADAYAAGLRSAPGTAVGTTGAGPARLAQFQEIEDVLPLIELATVAVILLVVAVYFRSLGAPLVTLLTAAAAYIVAVRVLAGAGEVVGISVPREIEPLLVVLLLGLVTDYTIFFLSEGRRRLLRGETRLEAARRATARMTPIVFTAGILVAGGTVALLAGKLEFFNAFGPGLALSAFIVTIVCITLVPAILGIAGPWLFGRRVRQVEAPDAAAEAQARGPEPGHVRLDAPRRERWRGRIAGPLGAIRVSRRLAEQEGRSPLVFLGRRMLAWKPVAFLMAVLCVGVMGVAATAVTRADLTVSFVRSLPSDSGPRRAGDDAARGFVSGIVAPVDVVFEREGIGRDVPALVRLQEEVAAQDGVAAALGPREIAGTPLARYAVTPEGGAARLLVMLEADPTGAAGIDAYERLREAMPGILERSGTGEARVLYGGETPLAQETIEAVLGDLERIAVAILVIGFVLLAIFLRSLVAPVLLLFASVLAFAASLGLTALLLPHVLGGTTLTYYVPLVAGVLLVSLGSDYNVFIAGSIREEARRRRLSEAIAVATPAASKAITVAGITLAGTFALLAIVPLRPFRELAMLLAIGVLLDALVLRPLLIPALISTVGRLTWWPSRAIEPLPSERFLARVAVHSGDTLIDARRMTEATLTTLGERLPARQRRELAAHLPDELAPALTDAEASEEPFGYHEFVHRVAQRECVSIPSARDDAAAVMATLSEALPASELEYVRAALPADYSLLLDARRPPPSAGERAPEPV